VQALRPGTMVLMGLGLLLVAGVLGGWSAAAGTTAVGHLLDWQSTTVLVLQADLQGIPAPERAATLQRVAQVQQRRLTDARLQVRGVHAEEPDRIRVELVGGQDVEQVTTLLVTPGRLDFREQLSGPDGTDTWVVTTATADDGAAKEVTGEFLQRAEVGFAPDTNRPLILFELTDEGRRMFAEVTRDLVGKPLGIFLDNQLLTAPVVTEPITAGLGQIAGNFTLDEVRNLVVQLNSGALPVPVHVIATQPAE
jgi:preprotein translocase subunit SecD